MCLYLTIARVYLDRCINVSSCPGSNKITAELVFHLICYQQIHVEGIHGRQSHTSMPSNTSSHNKWKEKIVTYVSMTVVWFCNVIFLSHNWDIKLFCNVILLVWRHNYTFTFHQKVNVVSPAFTMVATVLLTKRLSHIFSIDFNAFTFS